MTLLLSSFAHTLYTAIVFLFAPTGTTGTTGTAARGGSQTKGLRLDYGARRKAAAGAGMSGLGGRPSGGPTGGAGGAAAGTPGAESVSVVSESFQTADSAGTYFHATQYAHTLSVRWLLVHAAHVRARVIMHVR